MIVARKLTLIQLRLMHEVISSLDGGLNVVIVQRPSNQTTHRDIQNRSHVVGTYLVNIKSGVEIPVLKVHGKVIANLVSRGLLKEIEREELYKGKFYLPTDFAIEHKLGIEQELRIGEVPVAASWDWLRMTAKKWGCEITYIEGDKTFKISRVDGVRLRSNFLCESELGVPVFRIRDLTRQEWEDAIIHKIRHDSVVC